MKTSLAILIKKYKLSDKEVKIFFHNYCDAVLYNRYLREKQEYLKLESISDKKQLELIDFLKSQNIDEKIAKKIIVSAPMLFYCEDFPEQLDFVYKDSDFEGIIIRDEEGNNHPYRIKNTMRCITENPFMLNEIVLSSESDFKKVYYTRNKKL